MPRTARPAVELGLPLYFGDARSTARLEPTYVFFPVGPLWTGRLTMEEYFPRSRYFAGFSMNGHSYPLTSDAWQNFTGTSVRLPFGARF